MEELQSFFSLDEEATENIKKYIITHLKRLSVYLKDSEEALKTVSDEYDEDTLPNGYDATSGSIIKMRQHPDFEVYDYIFTLASCARRHKRAHTLIQQEIKNQVFATYSREETKFERFIDSVESTDVYGKYIVELFNLPRSQKGLYLTIQGYKTLEEVCELIVLPLLSLR